jgi:metallo-beta-lactamase class B
MIEGLLKLFLFSCILALTLCCGVFGQKAVPCPNCAEMNRLQAPFRVFGNTYYVGTHGLSSILITSSAGHVLIDGDLPESAEFITNNVRTLGFRIEDVKLIVNSHVHSDHAGGIAELQRRSGARVVASEWSAEVLRKGGVRKGDPQYGTLSPIAAVKNVGTVRDGEPLHVGDVTITPHLTPGHTPGGTSWTWKSCEDKVCYNLVYADSLNPISSRGFHFSDSQDYPHAVADFEKSFAFLDSVPCDILITAHPDLADLWDRLQLRDKGVKPNPLVDSGACRKLAETFRGRLKQRLAEESKK